jgi:hypothetical protein
MTATVNPVAQADAILAEDHTNGPLTGQALLDYNSAEQALGSTQRMIVIGAGYCTFDDETGKPRPATAAFKTALLEASGLVSANGKRGSTRKNIIRVNSNYQAIVGKRYLGEQFEKGQEFRVELVEEGILLSPINPDKACPF